MKKTAVLTVALSLFSATAVLAQAQAPREGPGVQAAQDAREPAVLAKCKVPPPPRPNFGAFKPPADLGLRYKISAIPDVIAKGKRWKVVWQARGNNADGIVGTADGGLLIAQNDNSDVVKLDVKGHASVVYRDTDTGGALSMNKQGQLFIDERGLNPAVWELAPQHKVLADLYQGDPLDCLGTVLNDLSAAANGGVYFTMGGLYYAAPDSTIRKYGDNLRTNGIILSPDEKTLYVTNNGTLVAFDVQPDYSLTNQRTLATLPGGGGDGSTVDADGRIYVTARDGIVVVSPQGEILGTIQTPRTVISLAFAGPDKKTLDAVAVIRFTHPVRPGTAAVQILSMPMIAQGYMGRAK